MVPKWRYEPVIALLLALALVTTACDRGVVPDTSTTATSSPTTTTVPETGTTAEPGPTGSLLVWADGTLAPVVEAAAQAFTSETGAGVSVEILTYGELRDAVMAAAPAGAGPDLFIGSHDWTGELVRAGAISPLGLRSRAGEFFEVAVDAFTYEGDLFGVPFAMEAVGLFYNKALVSEPPASFAALRSVCDDLGFPTEDGPPCLAIPAGEPLHQFPFIGGFGGYVFGFENGTLNLTDVGLDSAGAIAGAIFLSRLYEDGYADGEVDYSTMADLFNQGLVPFMWTGPWQIVQVDAAGIEYGVAGLPLMEGNPARPLVGVQGFFLNSFSENQVLAEIFLLDYVATTETVLQLSGAIYRVPALRSALNEITDDPNLAAFAESGIGGFPLPNVPELESVWGPLAEALKAIGRGADDPAAEMATAAEAVRSVLGGG